MSALEFASIGKQTAQIDVRLSYRIIELFSEGLYASPNKAIEELVANSFDAGAQWVHVLLSRFSRKLTIASFVEQFKLLKQTRQLSASD